MDLTHMTSPLAPDLQKSQKPEVILSVEADLSSECLPSVGTEATNMACTV